MKTPITLFFLLLSIASSAQVDSSKTLLEKFDAFRSLSLQEKIYLHTDRDTYLTGESIWFKVYNVDAARHRPLDHSKVAYIEVLDQNNFPVIEAKVALENGEGKGSVFVPATIASGNYTLRAYTHWMKNFLPDFYFHKTMVLINTFKKTEPVKPQSVQAINATFFPEGGDLVCGITSKVAFQITGPDGLGIEAEGTLVDQNNNVLISFSPFKFGLGHFRFTPQEGSHYHAAIKDKKGNSHTVELPAAKKHGSVMQVRDSGNQWLKITVSSLPIPTGHSPVYLFAHARQMVSYASMRILQQGKTEFVLDKTKLGQGINHITLFDKGLNPVAERLYCKLPERPLKISLNTDQPIYSTRRKVSIDLSISDSLGSTQPASLSVSVYRKDSLGAIHNETIHSYLWLSSDLSGFVESPLYYFNTSLDSAHLALDHLMLTHGWRRFAWNDVLHSPSKPFVHIPELKGHIIQGKLTHPDGSPSKNIAAYLSTPGKNIQLYVSRSSSQGNIKFEMDHSFIGSKKIIVQNNWAIDSTDHIEISSPFSNNFSKRPQPSLHLSSTTEKQLLTRSIALQVQDIFYESATRSPLKTGNDSIPFYGKADETYLLDDFTRFPVMEEVMREYVPGVWVRKRKDGFHFMVVDNVNHQVFEENPLILLDGIPVFDVDKIMAFNPLNVKKLDVLTRKYFIGKLMSPGIVSYTTYKGDLGGFELDPRSVTLDYDGLLAHREFYSPSYESIKERKSRMPDQRSLLYWNAQVVPSKDGKTTLQFYTSDLPGHYTISVEGLSKGGLTGSAIGSFTVKPNDNP